MLFLGRFPGSPAKKPCPQHPGEHWPGSSSPLRRRPGGPGGPRIAWENRWEHGKTIGCFNETCWNMIYIYIYTYIYMYMYNLCIYIYMYSIYIYTYIYILLISLFRYGYHQIWSRQEIFHPAAPPATSTCGRTLDLEPMAQQGQHWNHCESLQPPIC